MVHRCMSICMAQKYEAATSQPETYRWVLFWLDFLKSYVMGEEAT